MPENEPLQYKLQCLKIKCHWKMFGPKAMGRRNLGMGARITTQRGTSLISAGLVMLLGQLHLAVSRGWTWTWEDKDENCTQNSSGYVTWEDNSYVRSLTEICVNVWAGINNCRQDRTPHWSNWRRKSRDLFLQMSNYQLLKRSLRHGATVLLYYSGKLLNAFLYGRCKTGITESLETADAR
jgi:hypothetical protein